MFDVIQRSRILQSAAWVLVACLLSITAFGQQSLDLDAHYTAVALGHMDAARTIQVYALAKVKKSEVDTVRKVPHQEVIAYRYRQGDQWNIIAKFPAALWVKMTKVTNRQEKKTYLYFVVVRPNNRLFFYKYDPDTKGPLQELTENKVAKDSLDWAGIIALKATANFPPRLHEK